MDNFLMLIKELMGPQWFERFGGEVFLRKERLRKEMKNWLHARMRYAVRKDSAELKIRNLHRQKYEDL